MKIEIKNRWNGNVLFMHECEDNTVAKTLEAALVAGADLRYPDLKGADLRRADLCDADLRYADLQDADLRDADLCDADFRYTVLRNANFGDADLCDADLRHADLRGADLREAVLENVDLRRANLQGAKLHGSGLQGVDLRGADLAGAVLSEAGKILSDRNFLQVGPIGSRHDFLSAFMTEKGVFISTGCFFDSIEAFKSAVQQTHGRNKHSREYRAALKLIEKVLAPN